MVARCVLAVDGDQQLVAVHATQPVEHDVGEEQPPVGAGQAVLDASAVQAHDEPAAQLDPRRAGLRHVEPRLERSGKGAGNVASRPSLFARSKGGAMADRNASLYPSPDGALAAPPEELLYLACLHEGTGVKAPDFLAVIDAEEGGIVHETPMPNVGDELHHFGWNRCSSACHGPDRSHLIVPGFRSSRIHVLDVATDPRRPRIEKVIEPEEVVRKTGCTRPHTTHCM